MRRVVVAFAALAVSPLMLAIGVAALAGSTSGAQPQLSGQSVGDIPPGLFPHYVRAAEQCPGLSWTVIAAIAKVETNHARFGAARVQSNGDVEPAIIGPALNGTAGTTAIRDTDSGASDGDKIWDRAVGPFQFIPSTWKAYGADGNDDGIANPHNFYDAVQAAAKFLCAYAAGVGSSLRRAVLAYNHAGWYAERVLSIARDYDRRSVAKDRTEIVERYALPVPRDLLTIEAVRRPHHDYPAWDFAVPVGTPVYAVHGGKVTAVVAGGACGSGVIVAGADDVEYTYCHLSRIDVAPGNQVAAGSTIGASGNTGTSTGPHLHLQMVAESTMVCPQPLLEALYLGKGGERTHSTAGCIN